VFRRLLVMGFIFGGVAVSVPLASEMKLAQGGACTASCRAQYNQCRIATKGSSACDAQFAACMRRCISSRK